MTGAIYVAGFVGLLRGLTHADPYPPFMTDYQLKASRYYAQAEREFSEFVNDTFPIGSNAKQAVALLSSQGFDILSSSPASVQLLWARHAGPDDILSRSVRVRMVRSSRQRGNCILSASDRQTK
jgi:hypothetical protein